MYGIYDASTGRIDRTVECTPEQLAMSVKEGEAFIQLTTENDATHYVDIQESSLVAFPAQPHPAFRWDWTQMEWADPRSLDDVKAAKWEEVKRMRSLELEAGFSSQGNPFQCDPESKANIIGACQLAQVVGPSFTITWTCADNSVVILSHAQMIQVGVDMGLHINTMHAIARSLRTQIEEAETVDEIDAVRWPS